MEDQNRTVTRSMSSTQNPPPTNPVLEHTNSDNNNNTAPDAMEAAGADSASDSVAGVKPEAAGSELVMKRGRGRPRKYDANGNLLSPTSTPPPGFSTYPLEASEKRSRGRPRGSGKLQILASIGGFVAETAGGCFTPHLVIVNTGEDVVSRILSFFHRGPRAVCILSAVGAVSSVVIRQPGASGGILTYEGCFEIISLSGSCTYTSSAGGTHRKNSMLSITLAKPDGRVFGGGIESSLIAATPIQLVMATFKQNISKQIKRRHSSGSSTAPNVPSNPDSVRAHLKVPKLMEGEQSCPSPTSGLTPAATRNGALDNVIAATTNGVPDDVTPSATNSIADNIIPEDLNMHSASVNGVSLDRQTLQPITDQKKSADADANVPQI